MFSGQSRNLRAPTFLLVHSFQSLIADLATFTRITMAMGDSSATFLLYLKLTPTQERAFRLLGQLAARTAINRSADRRVGSMGLRTREPATSD